MQQSDSQVTSPSQIDEQKRWVTVKERGLCSWPVPHSFSFLITARHTITDAKQGNAALFIRDDRTDAAFYLGGEWGFLDKGRLEIACMRMSKEQMAAMVSVKFLHLSDVATSDQRTGTPCVTFGYDCDFSQDWAARNSDELSQPSFRRADTVH